MKRIFLSMLISAIALVLLMQLSTRKIVARGLEDYPLVCRGSESMVIGIAPGESNIGFAFTRGTRPAGEGLAPGECSWVDRGMYPSEPDRLSQHVEATSGSVRVGGTLAPENRWYEDLHSSDSYWTFMVSNNGRGQMIATSARPNERMTVSPTARIPAGIDRIRRPELPTNNTAPASASEIAITGRDVQALDSKLNNFTRQLPNDEQSAMVLLLRRAARAPLDDPSGTDVKVSFFRGIVVQGGRDAIIIQGGRTARDSQTGSPGGRPGNNTLRAALGGDTDPLAIGPKHEDPMPAPDTLTAIGPKHEDPRPAPDTLTAIGPKHEDPRPAPDTLTSIGPKHEDPSPPPPETINSLAGHLKDFSQQLSTPEQGIMDWLLQRASAGAQGSGYGTPGGRPPSPGQLQTEGTTEVREAARETGPPIGTPGGLPPLGLALGVARRGDPNNPNRWVLRF